MTTPPRTELARRYVDLSNAGRVDDALAMFADDATYESSQVGAFVGRDAIGEMMRAFFAKYGRPQWAVDTYRLVADDAAEFDFVMTATGEDRAPIERRGTERIAFDREGRIVHVAVGVRA